MIRVSITLCLALAVPLACEAPRAQPANDAAAQKHVDVAHPSASSTPVESTSTVPNDQMTGLLSEEEFKALHNPPTNSAPVRHGVPIVVDGAKCYLSLPPGASAPMPAIVVVHEWWGLNANIQHWTDRLAAEGYAALAVDLYGGAIATTPEQAMESIKKFDTARALEVMRAAHGFLKDDPRIRATKRACIGWGFGGSKALELALAAPDLDAVVMYYGFPVTEAATLAPLKAELLGIFGRRDKSIPAEKVAQFRQALTAAGKTFTLREYDAEHAFANPSNARYDEGAAADAWKEVSAFLKRKLLN